MRAVSICRSILPLVLLAPLAACAGSTKLEAKASVDEPVVAATAKVKDTPTRWEGDDEAEGHTPARPAKGRKAEDHRWNESGGPTATLPGFRLFTDGSSRVFLEVSGHVAVKETASEGLLAYRFQGVRVPERVNRLALPTQHFSTPVTYVQVRQAGSDAELLVHLRRAVKPKVHLKRSEASTVLSVDFPRYAPQAQKLDGQLGPASGQARDDQR